MKNRIRVFRQRNGLTLRQLADQVGTTPQTVSRLETGNMTLSTDWLQRFADVMRVHPVDLLEGPGSRSIQMLGSVDESGDIRLGREDSLTLDVPAENPVSVKLDRSYGPYRSGEILIGDRLPPGDEMRGVGRDCIVMTGDQRLTLSRVMPLRANGASNGNGHGGGAILVPLETAQSNGSGGALRNEDIAWAAPIIMRLRYL